MNEHPLELISAYADGELSREEASRVEAHLEECTECVRELALIRSIGGAMRTTPTPPTGPGVWPAVHRRLTRPIGWILFLAGVIAYAALAILEWYRERTLTLEWLGTTAIVLGLALLLASVAYEQYQEWKNTPYKDVDR